MINNVKAYLAPPLGPIRSSASALYIELENNRTTLMSRDSLVQYLYEAGGIRPYKCGYCKSQDTSYTQGVWGFRMTCQDYQKLVDRGFQRSGNFVYRPVMKKTCCPQYVIRMDVAKFKLSKAQKASIKKFKRYLVEGWRPTPEVKISDVVAGDREEASGLSLDVQPSPTKTDESTSSPSAVTAPPRMKKPIKAGLGPDPSKPSCKKAKVIRKEKKEQKKLAQLQQGAPLRDKNHPKPGQESTSFTTENCSDRKHTQNLKEILRFPKDEECVHRFKCRLVKTTSDDEDYTSTYRESFLVFQKFQTIIHKESIVESGEQQFSEFLINSPLVYDTISDAMTIKYGTYHQQYILDDKIFAVGVLDILPKGVLCEYLYYDPEYRFIAPGVITALLEVSLTQELHLQVPEMQYYYMGFYVQSCPKMNYKSRYSASDLLCPETYTYVPLGECIPKLKASPYSRLAVVDVETPDQDCTEEELNAVPVSMGSTSMTYSECKSLLGGETHMAEVMEGMMKEYVEMVGPEVAASMRIFLRRASADM